MKGCLSLIIKTIIAILVFFGLKYLGIVDFVHEKIEQHQENSQEQNMEHAKDIVDLSQVDEEYSIDRNLKILKNKVIMAKHEATGQRLIILEPVKGNILTKSDIKSEDIQDKINNIIKRYKNQFVRIDKVEITKHGEFEGINQTIPYIKMSAEITNLPLKDIEGIVGAAELDNGKNIIIISVNEKNKYSQIVTEAFFNKIIIKMEQKPEI